MQGMLETGTVCQRTGTVRAPCETSENIDTDLADVMDKQSLWGIGHDVKQ